MQLRRLLLATLLVATLLSPARAQESTALTDKIFQGGGTINVLKDIPGTTLLQMVQSDGRLFLGVDLNESLQGNEIPSSIGVAIKSLTLNIVTSQGTFSFSDFWTNTTSMVHEQGTDQAQSFYTLFGVTGSSGITSGHLDPATIDDVVVLNGVTGIQGEVLSASLQVELVDTATTSGVQDNNTFFDYSGGFEDFALLTPQDAATAEAGDKGIPPPEGVTYTESTVSPTTYVASGGGTTSTSGGTSGPVPPPSSGAPAPPLPIILGFGALALWRNRSDA